MLTSSRTTLRFTITAALLVIGCGPATTATHGGRYDEPRAPDAPAEGSADLPALSEGACGGFASLALGAPVSVLHDRVRVPTLEGARRPHWERAWSGASATLRRELEGHAFAANASEVYRTAPQGLDLAAAVAASQDDPDATVVARPASDDREQVLVFPGPSARDAEEDDGPSDEGLVPVLYAYVRTRDRSLVRVRFEVSREAYEEGGCERVAVALASGTVRGSRRLEAEGGERALLGGLTVTVPPGTVVEQADMGHWTENYVRLLSPLGEERTPYMMIRLDSHPGRPEVSVPTTSVTAPVFGQSAEWRTWVSETGFRWRDVIVPGGPAGNVWVAIGAETPETVDRLTSIAGNIGEGAVDRSPPSCERVGAPPPASELSLDPSSPAASALRTLLEASELHTTAARSASPQPTEAFEAMRALFRLPAADSAAAFRHLAERGTPAGRIYGLVGLHQVAASDFDAVACASREALSTPVPVADLCGVQPHDGVELLESSGPDTAFTVPARGAVDLRGGGLATQIYEQVVDASSSPLQGGGWVPPLAQGDASPAPLRPGAATAPRLVSSDGSQLIWTTRDGRTAQIGWGRTARYLEDVPVRHPRDLARGRHGSCVLDADGRRACWGGAIVEALRVRERECQVSMPDPLPYRVFDDGPWAELVLANGVCGILAADRSLHCFHASEYQRTWGATAAPGLFGAYPMPIEGRVIGVWRGEIHSQPAFYASTEDGALYQWDLNDAPRVIHRFDSPVEELAYAERVDFARLRDGRVFARGLRSVQEWWQPGAQQDGTHAFAEVEALLGRRIFPASRGACLLDPEQRAWCWGYFMDGTLGPVEADRHGAPPAEITAYRGASELLVDFGMTCARIGAMEVLCADENIEERMPGRMRDGFLHIDLDQLRPQAAAD